MALPILKGPFTAESFQRLAQLGILREDERVELIDGQVVEMTPIGERHAACVRRVAHHLSHVLRDVAIVDVQNPLVLDGHHVPQPDLMVLEPRADLYPSHPQASDTLLVVEVADTSLAYDVNVKLPLYARAGIPEAWLVDLPADLIWVRREPAGDTYTNVRAVCRGDTISPLRFPDVTFSVDDILG